MLQNLPSEGDASGPSGIRSQSSWPNSTVCSGEEGCLLSQPILPWGSEGRLVASSDGSRVQELCWDAHESASLEGGAGVGGGALESCHRWAGGAELWAALRWSAGALAFRRFAEAGPLQGALLTQVVEVVLALGIRRPGFEPVRPSVTLSKLSQL